MELKLSEQFFKKNFDIRLGARDDQCTDEDELSGAIPQIWARDLEREATEKLWWQKFTGKALDDAVIRKDELINKPGDRIKINKINQLTNVGHLGLTHLLEDDEEKLHLGEVDYQPDRWGNAVCWPYIIDRKVHFNMRLEVKSILADWMATTLDNIVWTAAVLSTNVIWGGVAGSRAAVVDTDTFGAHELKRLSVLLEENKAKAVRGITGSYVCMIHPRQKYDLLNDADWVAAARYEGSSKIFKAYIGTYMDIDVFTTGQVPTVDSGASPSVTIYQAVAFGARSVGIAYGAPITWREKLSSYGGLRLGFRHFCKKLQFTNWVNSGKPKFFKKNRAILSQAYREIKRVGRKVQRLGREVFSPITVRLAPGTLWGEEIVQVR